MILIDFSRDLIFIPVADKIKDATYSCYDIKPHCDVVTGKIDVRDVDIPDYEQVEETLDKADDNTLNIEDEITEEV